MLKGLKKFGHEELPADARTLKSAAKKLNVFNVEKLGSGTYAHYGLEKALKIHFECVDRKSIPDEIMLNIHVDGLSVAKSSNSQVWPMLGKIINSTVFSEPLVTADHEDEEDESIQKENEEEEVPCNTNNSRITNSPSLEQQYENNNIDPKAVIADHGNENGTSLSSDRRNAHNFPHVEDVASFRRERDELHDREKCCGKKIDHYPFSI